MQINRDDVCALGLALQIKKKIPHTSVHLLSVGPQSIVPLVEDFLRVGVDEATIFSDNLFEMSDAMGTAKILARYLSAGGYDVILSGTYASDGGSACVPPMVAELLGVGHLSGISGIDEPALSQDTTTAVVEVEDSEILRIYQVDLPAILSLTHRSGYRVPYVRMKDKNRDVSDRVRILDNRDLGFAEDEIGERGSRVKIVRHLAKGAQKGVPLVVGPDQQGVDTVFTFLKENHFI